ncbi:MAG TPA: DUF1491 family protein [Roseiarcus sp.]|nr:DUF1491 family protein [Roseiarcus sp.]
MRLRSDIWVAAYLRRCGVEGANAVLRRRGAAEAGAIFVKVDHLDGRATLYEPAPQSVAATAQPGVERLFSRAHEQPFIDSSAAEERLKREIAFDPDLWIVEVEDGADGAWLDLEP